MASTRSSLIRLSLPLLCLLGFLHASLAQDSYTIGLWNVQNFGVTDRFINDKRVANAMKPETEIRAMTAILKRMNPDVLGLVEILRDPEDKYIKLLRKTLKDAGLNYPHMATCTGEDPRIQNVLLSRYPIVRTEHITEATFKANFKDPKTKVMTEVQRKVGRGIHQSIVEIRPGHEVRVFLAHLKSKRPFPEIISDDPEELGDGYVRRQEALILRGAMMRAAQANPKERIIAMGDFNDEPRSRAVTTIIGGKTGDVRFYDLWLQDWLGDWWTHFYIPDKSYSRIDYMVVSQQLFDEWDKTQSYIYRQNQKDPPEFQHQNASDHRPLLATFTIPPPAPAPPAPAKP